MLTILFWNLAKRPLIDHLSALVEERGVDILLVAESPYPSAAILTALNPKHPYLFEFAPPLLNSKVQTFARFSPVLMPCVADDPSERATLRYIKLPGRTPFLLCAIHFPPRVNWQISDQTSESEELNAFLRAEEQRIGTSSTLVVGDFNMDPFDAGLIHANGFNAVRIEEIAKRGTRTINGRAHPFFYNPMWNAIGAKSAGTAGSLYFHPNSPLNN